MFSPELKKGSLDLLVLALCSEEDLHGYGIGKRIEERSEGRLVFRVSTLYPTLKRLEEKKLLAGRWVERPPERRRRYYKITARGRRELEQQRDLWSHYVSTITSVLAPRNA